MLNKELLTKVFDVSCSLEELREVVSMGNSHELAIDDAFDGLYSLERILKAIKRYEDKEVDDKYLACWANAYDWICLAGFKYKDFSNVSIEEVLIYKITNLLDSLSFFDDEEGYYDLDMYKTEFTTLDYLYKSRAEWRFCYAEDYSFSDEPGIVRILFWREETKEYAVVYYDGDDTYTIEGRPLCEKRQLKEQIEAFDKDGYRRLPMGWTSDDEDEE